MRTQQFDTSLLEELFEIANQIKLMTRKPNGIDFLKSLLRHKKAMLYFTQPSTRTFLSFLGACQLVGMDTAEVRDPSLSSEYKGESQEDAVRVFSSYFDMIVMRDPKPGFCDIWPITLTVPQEVSPSLMVGVARTNILLKRYWIFTPCTARFRTGGEYPESVMHLLEICLEGGQ